MSFSAAKKSAKDEVSDKSVRGLVGHLVSEKQVSDKFDIMEFRLNPPNTPLPLSISASHF